MIKERLKLQQPVAYQTLKHALINDKMAHAYIFSGPSKAIKKEAAYLLAQSLLCEQEGFACEQCSTCQRVLRHEYADMIYLDGTTTSIKKDDIVKLQKAFQKTVLEKDGKKIYIIDQAENATVEALNSLLKFLEEPTSDMIAILLVDQLDRLLPTIVSRCQIIPFKAMNRTQCFEMVKNEVDIFDAYMLSNILKQPELVIEVSETQDYQHAKFVMKGMIDRYIKSVDDALVFVQLEGFNAKEKKYGKQAFQYLVDMLYIFFKDCMQGNSIDDTWYQTKVSEMKLEKHMYLHILQTLMYAKDKVLFSVNLQLLIDQMFYEMKEVRL